MRIEMRDAQMDRNMKLSSLILLVGCLTVIPADGEYLQGTVYMTDGKAEYVSGKLDKAGAAYATMNGTLLTTGWDVLNIKAGYGKPMSNNDLMYAAGYAEGVLTARQMWANYQNMKTVLFGEGSTAVISKVRDFFAQQDQWVHSMIDKHGAHDPFWRHISYVVSQADGLLAGYRYAAEKDWDTDAFVVQMLNGVGDIIDLKHALNPELRPQFSTMTKSQLKQFMHRSGHCSALIKVTGAYENILMSHSSWFVYAGTLRIYKHYDFNLDDPDTAAKRMSFSSYAGFLESLDDFYILSSNMILLQTTNNILNMSLYELVVPQSVSAWQRVRVANFMATNGQQWSALLSRYNSGTYNNQYMVLDLKEISLNKEIRDNALWVVEQIPGLVYGADETQILRAGYWPSYNVPFHEVIYNRSGYPSFVKEHGLDFSYQLAPRAKIFRRDQDKVSDVDSMKFIMRYNDYLHDKYSEHNPCDTICCRGDLDPNNPVPDGCYDTKVTDFNMAQKFQSYAISGPTRGTGLKPFEWTGIFSNVSHIGLPEKYDFDWVFMQPQL